MSGVFGTNSDLIIYGNMNIYSTAKTQKLVAAGFSLRTILL